MTKGYRTEVRAEKILESLGYQVRRVVKTSRFVRGRWINNPNDIFGVDIIAKKRGERTRWIQVTAGSGIGERIARLRAVAWDEHHDSVELWRWVGEKRAFNKKTGKARDQLYFQVYRLDSGFTLEPEDRIREMSSPRGPSDFFPAPTPPA